MQPYGLCPKCLAMAYLTRHHIYPRRHFRRQRNPACVHLCRVCHDELERRIPIEKRSKRFYTWVVRDFLGIPRHEATGACHNHV